MADERLLNHADVEQIATLLEQSAKLTPGVNDGAINKLPSHADGTRLGTAIGELKNTGAFTAQYEFDTVSEMNTAIQAGTVKEGATIYVKEGSGSESGGHTIQNPSGTSMTQRTNLKFVGASVTDDLTNDATIVEVPSDADDISYGSGTVANKLDKIQTENLTFYVDATNGSDSNDGLSASTAFATIQKAINKIPANVPYYRLATDIYLANGIYDGFQVSSGVYVRLYAQDTSNTSITINGTNTVNNNSRLNLYCPITFNISTGSALVFYGASFFNNEPITITSDAETPTATGISCGALANLDVYGKVTFNNLKSAYVINRFATVHIRQLDVMINISEYGYNVTGGILQATNGLAVNVNQRAIYGGRIYVGTQPVIESTPTNNTNNVPSSAWAYAFQNKIEGNISNPNLLDNPWFTVNQRGQSSYTDGYGFDRWTTFAGSSTNHLISKNNDIITYTVTGQYRSLGQKIESNRLIFGKQYTLSILFSNNVIESITFTLTNSSSWNNIKDSWTSATHFYTTYRVNGNNMELLILDSDAPDEHSVSFKAVKLEVGSISTLAMDTAPNYATELLKCQRYYQRLALPTANTNIAPALATSSSAAIASLELPVPMRATPTFTVSDYSKFSLMYTSATALTSAPSITDDAEHRHISMSISKSGLTSGRYYYLQNNTADAYMEFSADL